ncbi:hypothetical protein RchiOBHm_Chr3g0450021 [Rosa chinensis]|uniref:Uncharacterized protein n=1 Tax=Rosa chinensis TaxID=74649 RepID=A0A2P6R5M9_ROSCH|nr:hypothetical protein RchiOBHm_Chr3g0450021 [Rosa chinensis]
MGRARTISRDGWRGFRDGHWRPRSGISPGWEKGVAGKVGRLVGLVLVLVLGWKRGSFGWRLRWV